MREKNNAYLDSQTYFLEADNLCMYFPTKNAEGKPALIHAADKVSFKVPKGKTLGIVGESGCGKSTVGKMLVDLYKPTSGRILYEGRDLVPLSEAERRPYIKKMQLVWQDPYSSLDPRMRAIDIVEEGIRNFCPELKADARREKAMKLLKMCGLYEEHANFYPYQFSGGQRQRVCIARALATDPELVVCDEAVSALDVSIQAQIINLLKDLQDELQLTYLFISHDLNVIRFISDEIIVMYLGEIVERGTMETVYQNRAHPYTRALFAATPVFAPGQPKKPRELLTGDVMSPIAPPPGCRFASRCPHATDRCKEAPEWHKVEENHFVRCHLYDNNE